jgi:thiol-disulfide isomerase/thioredoxin
MPDRSCSLAAAVIASALFLAACDREPAPPEAAAPPPASAPAPAAPEPPKAEPNLEFPALAVDTFDGGRFVLADHRGKWVVVNFWATWCGPCLEEIPDLAELDAKRDDVQVVGLAYEEIERADMEAFLKEHPVPYPFAIVDVTAPPPDFGNVPGLPMTVLVSPEGKVVKKFFGATTSADLEKLIAAAGEGAAAP